MRVAWRRAVGVRVQLPSAADRWGGVGRGVDNAVAVVPVVRQHRPDVLRVRMGNPAVRSRLLRHLRGCLPDGTEHVAAPNLAMDAVPPDVRRRLDQAARRSVLARSHLLELLLRDPADAQPAELVFPLDASRCSHSGCGGQSPRRSDRAVRVFRAAAVRLDCRHHHRALPGRAHRLRQPVVAQLAHGRALYSARQRQVAGVAAGSSADRSLHGACIPEDALRGGRRCRAAQHLAGDEHVVLGAVDECQFRATSPGEHVRRIRQHHA